MSLRPILSTLARHRIAAGLIVVEVALALAFVCNALHMMALRVEHLQRTTGLAESELLHVDLRAIAPISEADALTAEDLRRLRALPGVKGVTISNQVVYGDNSNNSGVSNEANDRGTRVDATRYSGNTETLKVLGLKLISGRDFVPEDMRLASALGGGGVVSLDSIIVNRSLAEALFPGQSALDKPVWLWGDRPLRIVGIVEDLPRTGRRGRLDTAAFILPVQESFRGGVYLLRAEPAQHARVLKEAAQVLREVDPRRSARHAEPLIDMRERYYAEDRAMTGLLAGVCVALLAVTAFGIVGLASFWVAQRTRMIGVRRALGATRTQIRQYFQLENLLLCGAGVLLGVAGAVAISQWVMQPEGVPPLPWVYLPAGALLLLLLGQLAVLAPARRASTLPAATAMRA